MATSKYLKVSRRMLNNGKEVGKVMKKSCLLDLNSTLFKRCVFTITSDAAQVVGTSIAGQWRKLRDRKAGTASTVFLVFIRQIVMRIKARIGLLFIVPSSKMTGTKSWSMWQEMHFLP